MGHKVYMDLRCVLKHSGNALYPLSYQEQQLFAKAPSPVALDNCAGDSAATFPSPPPAQLESIVTRSITPAIPA
jgi:hypothetical protein